MGVTALRKQDLVRIADEGERLSLPYFTHTDPVSNRTAQARRSSTFIAAGDEAICGVVEWMPGSKRCYLEKSMPRQGLAHSPIINVNSDDLIPENVMRKSILLCFAVFRRAETGGERSYLRRQGALAALAETSVGQCLTFFVFA